MDSKRTDRLGIWRLGSTLQVSPTFHVNYAQPVDAVGSPRWDYIIKSADSTAGRDGITRSISLGTALSHPNVVPILDGEIDGKTSFLVMPLLEGRTMKWHLSNGPRKPLPVALWLVRQICQGLQAIHSTGWTHGDVKPENLIVGSNGHVTLIDLAYAHQGTMLQSSPFQGTPQYAAPELLVNASAGSPASDLFAAGRILWEWLSRVDTSSEQLLGPVCELVECMVDQSPMNRPTTQDVTKALLRLEIDTLGEHIVPKQRRLAA